MADAAEATGIEAKQTPAPRMSVLMLGDFVDRELAPIASRVTSLADNETRAVKDFDGACQIISNQGWHPDLIVALQSCSDQFSPADVLRLLSIAPLARVVCVAGAWCDSDGRTRPTWPIAARIRATDALTRIESELAALRFSTQVTSKTGGPPASVLPLTASRAEVFAADMNHQSPFSIDSSQIIIHSPDRVWLGMIESAFGIRSSSTRSRTTPPKAVLVDVDPWGERAESLLRASKTTCPNARLIACTGVAASDSGDELKAAGADGVWFKLSPLAALKRLVAMS